MKLLLDTHALVWSVNDPGKLSTAALNAVMDPANDRFISAASVWELAIKWGMGKITLLPDYRAWTRQAITALGLDILPVTVEYAAQQSLLPVHHKDPFDRLILAQSILDAIPIVSSDAAFDPYGITRIW